jgi:hypothetical protein
MEAVTSLETLIPFYQTAWLDIPEQPTLIINKPNTFIFTFGMWSIDYDLQFLTKKPMYPNAVSNPANCGPLA